MNKWWLYVLQDIKLSWEGCISVYHNIVATFWAYEHSSDNDIGHDGHFSLNQTKKMEISVFEFELGSWNPRYLWFVDSFIRTAGLYHANTWQWKSNILIMPKINERSNSWVLAQRIKVFLVGIPNSECIECG